MTPVRAAYDLAIFDFDGTLADTAEWFLPVLNDMADRFGFRRISAEEGAAMRRLGSREIIRSLRVPVWKIPAIARHIRQRAAQEAHLVRLFPGVLDMLAELRGSGIAIAIVSSNLEATIKVALGSEGRALVDFYDCRASLFGKAARFRSVLERSGADPSRTIAIGDEARDIEAARKAGIRAGAVCWGYADPAFLESLGPDVFFDRIEDIALKLGG